jgi:hypothetical protein
MREFRREIQCWSIGSEVRSRLEWRLIWHTDLDVAGYKLSAYSCTLFLESLLDPLIH